jgi:hypothetical protein
VEAIRIPDDDRTQRIVEHEPENFESPSGSSCGYTLIEITAFPGRSGEAKRNLYRALYGGSARSASTRWTSRS